MRKDSIDKVAAARSQSACLVLTLYCENVDCAGRKVVVTVKDHDRTLVAFADSVRGFQHAVEQSRAPY